MVGGRDTKDHFAAYLDEMAGDGRYLEHLELSAAARAFDPIVSFFFQRTFSPGVRGPSVLLSGHTDECTPD